MNIRLDISPKQKLFIQSQADETLFGGAAGGGKSYGQLLDALQYSQAYAKSKQLILRKTFPELDRSIIRVAFELFPKEWYTYNASKHTMTLANGSIIDFGHCENDAAVIQYQSAEYDVIRFDELTHFSEYQYLYLLSRVRGANGYPKMTKSSTNPGGEGHAWVKARFIDIGPPGREYMFGGRKRVFIPSFVQDNEFLMKADPDYIKRLEELPEDDRRALLDGDWDVYKGQFFTEFKRKDHVVSDMRIDRDWRVYRVLDYGLDMLACYWIAIDYAENAYVFRELYEPGLIASDAAQRIKAYTHERITATYAPPDLWNRRNDSGRSVTEIFLREGIPLFKAPNNRVNGWLNVKEWLQVRPDEFGETKPRLLIHESCANLIRCIPSLQHDKHNPNDVSSTPHEITHGPDAIRYFCAARTLPAQREEPPDVVFEQETALYRYGM